MSSRFQRVSLDAQVFGEKTIQRRVFGFQDGTFKDGCNKKCKKKNGAFVALASDKLVSCNCFAVDLHPVFVACLMPEWKNANLDDKFFDI